MYTKKQFKSSLIAASLSTVFASSFSFAQDISGTVVDEQGNIVAGALIEIKGSDKKQKTDAQGNFLFSDLGLSNVELHISAPKYAHKYKQLTHTKDEDQKNITVSLSQSSIEVIDVYATPLHTSTIESAIPVNVLSGEELKRKQASTLGSTLKNEVGIHQTYYGSVTSSPIIRGLDGPRVMITQNGLDSGDASRVGADHTVSAETSTATQVEVLRGPATLFYGSGAIGGVVNVVDNRVPKSSDTEVDWLLQHNTGASEDQGSLALQTGTENIALHVDGFFRNSDNYILPEDFVNDDEHNPEHDERLPNSDSKSSGFNVGTSYLLDDGYIGFSYGYLSKDYGIPGHHHHEEDHAEAHEEDHEAGHEVHEEGEERVAAAMEQSRYQLLSEINFQQSFIEKLATKIAYTDYQHQEIEDGQIGTTFSNESLEAKFDLTHQNLAGWHGAWTVHYKHSDFEAIGEEAFTPPSETEMIALAWLEEKHFGNVLLQLGARAEQVSVSADDSYIGFHDDHQELVSFETQDFTPLSASVGLVYDYNKGYNLGLATSFSQRAPSAAELFSFGPHIGSQAFEIGAMFELEEEINPEGEEELHVELSAEKPSIESSYNIDLTWRKFEGDFGFVVSAFYNHVDNFYYQQDTGHHFEEDHDAHADEHLDEHADEHEEVHGDEEHEDGLPILVYQQNDVEMYGLEAEFAYQITSDFSAKLFGDVIKTKLIGGEEDGNSLPRIPPMRLGTTFAYQGSSFDTDISVSHFFEQDDIAELETTTPGYTIVDFTFNYFLDAGVFNTPGLTDTDLVVFLKGENLTDEYGMVHSSFLKETAPLMGRSFSFGIRGSF